MLFWVLFSSVTVKYFFQFCWNFYCAPSDHIYHFTKKILPIQLIQIQLTWQKLDDMHFLYSGYLYTALEWECFLVRLNLSNNSISCWLLVANQRDLRVQPCPLCLLRYFCYLTFVTDNLRDCSKCFSMKLGTHVLLINHKRVIWPDF